MNIKTLINVEDIKINDRKFFVSSIPAIPAQKMLMKAFSAFSAGNIAGLPEDIAAELLSYAGAYNQNDEQVQFVDEETVALFVSDPLVLMEIEVKMVEKNFGFLGDGKFQKLMERLGKVVTPTVS